MLSLQGGAADMPALLTCLSDGVDCTVALRNSLLPQAGFGVLIATVSVPQLFIIMT